MSNERRFSSLRKKANAPVTQFEKEFLDAAPTAPHYESKGAAKEDAEAFNAPVGQPETGMLLANCKNCGKGIVGNDQGWAHVNAADVYACYGTAAPAANALPEDVDNGTDELNPALGYDDLNIETHDCPRCEKSCNCDCHGDNCWHQCISGAPSIMQTMRDMQTGANESSGFPKRPKVIIDDPEFQSSYCSASRVARYVIEVERQLAAAQQEIAELKRVAEAWEETAAQHCRNEMFYRGIVVEIGEPFGIAAKTSDDGSIQQDVLALKVPELVTALRQSHAALLEKDTSV